MSLPSEKLRVLSPGWFHHLSGELGGLRAGGGVQGAVVGVWQWMAGVCCPACGGSGAVTPSLACCPRTIFDTFDSIYAYAFIHSWTHTHTHTHTQDSLSLLSYEDGIIGEN